MFVLDIKHYNNFIQFELCGTIVWSDYDGDIRQLPQICQQ